MGRLVFALFQFGIIGWYNRSIQWVQGLCCFTFGFILFMLCLNVVDYRQKYHGNQTRLTRFL